METGQTIAGKYRLNRLLGTGGMASVWSATNVFTEREFAIKFMLPQVARTPEAARRFLLEAKISARINHPNIIEVIDVGQAEDSSLFLVMELLTGMSLDVAMRRRTPSMLVSDFMIVMRDVAQALAAAHRSGVIHRDLKPTNIMISDFGQVYVLDWGIARLLPPDLERGSSVPPRARDRDRGDGETADLDPPGALIGTACYMAPEQVRGLHDALDERTDVFALGATLYQILTGRPPLTPDIVRAIWMRRAAAPVAAPDLVVPGGAVPPDLSRIALRATAYDPAGRYASVSDLKRDIEAFQRGAWDFPRTKVPAGFVIVTEGEPGRAAYVIIEGRCVAYRVEGDTEIELRIMDAGDVFGETAVFSDKPRTASVRAATDCLLLVVTSEVLSSAVGLNSWMGAFVKALADRFREADERLRMLERQQPRRRSEPDSPTG